MTSNPFQGTGRELSTPPFEVPSGIPRPPDAKILSENKALKGGTGNLAYETKSALSVIYAMYESKIIGTGLTLMSGTKPLEDSENFNLTFSGWPGRKVLSITCVDRAYQTSEDKRFCAIMVQ
jgi:hypothetical protein